MVVRVEKLHFLLHVRLNGRIIARCPRPFRNLELATDAAIAHAHACRHVKELWPQQAESATRGAGELENSADFFRPSHRRLRRRPNPKSIDKLRIARHAPRFVQRTCIKCEADNVRPIK